MATGRTERRLAAILAADVVGYSRLMGANKEGTRERLKAHFRQLIDPKIQEHRGRIVKNTGDGLLVEFPSVVDATRCAAEIQHRMIDRNADVSEYKRISFRIGVNLGDVIVEPEEIFGDGINIAARLEALAEPDGICVWRTVHDHIDERLPYSSRTSGSKTSRILLARCTSTALGLTRRPRCAHQSSEPQCQSRGRFPCRTSGRSRYSRSRI